MKTTLTSLFCCLTFFVLQAQNFNAVDQKVKQYPKHFATAEQFAATIEKDFTSDSDKVRAIYTWLTHNITYDLEKFYNGDTQINFSYTNQEDFQRKLAAVNEHSVKETMRTNKAVCEGFARTFKKVSELLKIPCLFIGGYSKAGVNDIGVIPQREDHAWNAVKVDNKWRLIDATWGAGHTQNKQWKHRFDDFYFFTDPDVFALTHLPGEAELSFTSKKITLQKFYNTPVFGKPFIKNKLKLISPLEGQLKVRTGDTINFELEKIPENVSLHYAFRENMRPTPIEPNCSDSTCTFEIPFTGTENTEFFIIVNKETALQYKVRIK